MDFRTKHRVRIVASVLLCLCVMSGISGCRYDVGKTIRSLRDDGYTVEQTDHNTFYITEDGADYYFKREFIKPVLEKIVITMQVEVHDVRKVEIIITKEFGLKRTVSYSYYNDEGKRFNYDYFEFVYDFSDEHLTNDRGFQDKHGSYLNFTETFMSVEEIQSLYDRGLELEKEL